MGIGFDAEMRAWVEVVAHFGGEVLVVATVEKRER